MTAANRQEFERELRSALWTADWIIRQLIAGKRVRNLDESLAEIRR